MIALSLDNARLRDELQNVRGEEVEVNRELERIIVEAFHNVWEVSRDKRASM
jgi:hypothetical protein